MTDLLELIRRYEPVLRFSKDGEDRPEAFFPMSARDYVHGSGLRRRKIGWEREPGSTLLTHLSTVSQPKDCYLAYAAGDLPPDGDAAPDLLLELMDQGLELSGGAAPVADDASSESDLWVLEGFSGDSAPPGERTVTPRVLVSRQRADELAQQLSDSGGAERRSIGTEELSTVLGAEEEPPSMAALESAFDLSLPPGTLESTGDAPPTDADLELAALNLEWLVPKGLAALPNAIRERAQEKYEPYRDWGNGVAPIYHYHVCQDRGYRVLQYWFFYAYNDWAAHGGHNDHEGDWEVIYVFLDDENKPQHVAYSRHVSIPYIYKPDTAKWSAVERVSGSVGEATHPVVYVGCGSHASYLRKDRHKILWLTDYADGSHVSIGPGADQPWGDPARLTARPWNTRFSGNWGSLIKNWLGLVSPGTEGPTGPAQKGDKWRHPAKWAGIAEHK